MGVKNKNRNIKGKKFASSNSHWVVQHRTDKGTYVQVWVEDDILRIQSVRKGLSDKLRMCGINTVKDSHELQNERIDELSASGISRKMLTSTIEKIQNANLGAYENPLTNHRTRDNPHANLYPNENEERLAVSSAMKPFVCIKDLVLYIISESQRVMLGTVHEKTGISTMIHSLS